MGAEKTARMGLLERLLDIARAQKKLLSENRLGELAKTMAERDDVVSRLKSAGAPAGKEEGNILKKILDYDSNLRVSLEVELEEIRRELEKLSDCNVVNKAYLSTQVKTVERSLRNG